MVLTSQRKKADTPSASCADPILSSQHRRQARTCLHMHANDLMTSMCSHRDSAWVQITPPTRTARWSASKNGCRAAATAHKSADSERDSPQHCPYTITAHRSRAYSEHVNLPQPTSLSERDDPAPSTCMPPNDWCTDTPWGRPLLPAAHLLEQHLCRPHRV